MNIKVHLPLHYILFTSYLTPLYLLIKSSSNKRFIYNQFIYVQLKSKRPLKINIKYSLGSKMPIENCW